MILLLFLSILVLLLCFTPKEGFYSDNNVVTAIATVNQLKNKLETTKDDIKKIKENSRKYLTTMDIKSNLEPILRTNKDSLFATGVVQNVKSISDKLSSLQEEFDSAKETVSTIDVLNTPIDNLLVKLDEITKLLNSIPDT
jgi:phage shock protein A